MEDLRAYFEMLLDEARHTHDYSQLDTIMIPDIVARFTVFDVQRLIAACDLAIVNKSDYKAQYDSRF